MKKNMTTFLKNKFFRNIFVMYFLLLGGIFILLFVVTVFQAAGRKQEQIRQNARNVSAQMAQILDGKLGDAELVAMQIVDSNWEKYVAAKSDILYSRIDYFKRQEICQVVSSYKSLLGIAQSVAILYINRDMVVDERAFWESDRYFQSLGMDGEFMDTVRDIADVNYNALVMRREDDKLILIKRIDYATKPDVVLMVVIDDRLFARYLSNNMSAVASLSFQTEGSDIYTWADNAAYYSDAILSEVSMESAMYRWTYQFEIGYHDYDDPAYGTGMYLFSCIGALLLSILLSYGLARFTYRPMQMLAARIDIISKDELIDLEDIETIYENLRLEKETMENLANQYYETGKNGFIYSLLKGTYGKGEAEEYVKQYQIGFERNMTYLTIAIVGADLDKQSDLMGEILKFQGKYWQHGVHSQLVAYGDIYVLILGSVSEKEILLKARENLELLMDYYPDNAETELIAGTPHEGLAGIHQSWREAEDKMLLMDRQETQKGYYYPYEVENLLINAMRMGNFAQAEEILDRVRGENAKRDVPPEQINRVVRLIYEGCVRLTMEGMINWVDGEQLLPDPDEKIVKDDPWQFLKGCFNKMESVYYSEKQSETLGEKILEYVQENYTNAGISQQIIADYFKITRPAVSKIFKETMGLNFIEYLHRKRIAYAKMLIEKGNYDVISVAQKSGYENEVTFKRAFVKYEGDTPRKYIKRIRQRS